MKEKLDEYFKLLQEVYDYFGFVEEWVVIPLDDRREYNWRVNGTTNVEYGEEEDILKNTGNQYSDEIYTQRFYKEWVYRAKDYTMIMVDTHTDGNKFLAVYDNSKEIK